MKMKCMSKKNNPEAKSQSQSDKFKAMAKEVEADSSEALFDEMLEKVIKPKKETTNKD